MATQHNVSHAEVHTDDGLYWFERDFDGYFGRRFLERNWSIAVVAIAAYVTFVLAGPVYMKNRPRFQLRAPLFLWNVSLAAFSIFGTCRVTPYAFDLLKNKGIYGMVCDHSYFIKPVTGVWSFVFTLSKILELGDTVFIVLRKQPLIFLHWYHHVTVLLFCWHGNSEFTSTGQLFGLMNFIVHSLMYTYYALKSLRIKLPNVVALFITSFQLSQMAVGIAGNFLAYSWKKAGRSCHISDLSLQLAFLMYLSYFILFANFFYRTYVRRGAKRSIAVAEKTEQVLSQAQILAKKAL